MVMQDERQLIVQIGKEMSAAKLSTGTSGNLSIYDPEHNRMAISPSGIPYGDTMPEDVVIMDLDGNIVDGHRKPSSEWALHAAYYRHNPKARGVVHTHSVYCATFAALGMPIRAVHYVIGDAGVDTIPCAPYETFGTMALAETTMQHCGDSDAVLLGNHGLLTCGTSLNSAYSLARNVEFIAEVQYRAMTIGTPNILSKEEMDKVMARFQSYGQTSGTTKGY